MYKIEEKELSVRLKNLFEAENQVAEIVKKSGLRFSLNKITADLGEFFAYQVLSRQKNIFESILPQSPSNAEFDILGTLTPNSVLLDRFGKKELKIEVKTRRNQKGVKYLSSLKPEKFDLLCVVDLAANYTLNKVYLVESKVAKASLDIKRQRLIFKETMAFMILD
jgi:hypothetical protein